MTDPQTPRGPYSADPDTAKPLGGAQGQKAGEASTRPEKTSPDDPDRDESDIEQPDALL